MVLQCLLSSQVDLHSLVRGGAASQPNACVGDGVNREVVRRTDIHEGDSERTHVGRGSALLCTRARGAAAAGGLEQLVTAAATEDCVLGVVIAARRGLHVLFDRFWLPGSVPNARSSHLNPLARVSTKGVKRNRTQGKASKAERRCTRVCAPSTSLIHTHTHTRD